MEIGSFFEFPRYDCDVKDKSALQSIKTCYGTYSHKCLFVGDGRQAIKAVLLSNYRLIKGKKCYLPAYLCSSILQPFKELKLDVEFYSHSYPLKPNIDCSLENSLIYIIDFFGIESLRNKEILKLSENNLIILDITHSIFNVNRFNIKKDNIYLIASLRKLFPIPDGGVIFYEDSSFSIDLDEPDRYEAMLEAMFLKKFYLETISEKSLKHLKDVFFEQYLDYEILKDRNSIQLKKMSEISLKILNNLSIENIINRRNHNLLYIYSNIDKRFLIFDYNKLKSPFFVPLIFSNDTERDCVRTTLIKNGIYPPVHWKLPDDLPSSFEFEYNLSKRIISIPIDQRYAETELNFVLELLR